MQPRGIDATAQGREREREEIEFGTRSSFGHGRRRSAGRREAEEARAGLFSPRGSRSRRLKVVVVLLLLGVVFADTL